jgi:hypothetical protein
VLVLQLGALIVHLILRCGTIVIVVTRVVHAVAEVFGFWFAVAKPVDIRGIGNIV